MKKKPNHFTHFPSLSPSFSLAIIFFSSSKPRRFCLSSRCQTISNVNSQHCHPPRPSLLSSDTLSFAPVAQSLFSFYGYVYNHLRLMISLIWYHGLKSTVVTHTHVHIQRPSLWHQFSTRIFSSIYFYFFSRFFIYIYYRIYNFFLNWRQRHWQWWRRRRRGQQWIFFQAKKFP